MRIFAPLGMLVFLVSSAWAEPVSVEAVKTPHQAWQFHRLNVSQDQSGITVSGRINAPVTSRRPPMGHIDLAAYAPNGDLITETTARYIPKLLSPRYQRRGGARFSAFISQDLPAGSVIKVAFHEDDLTPTNPVHAFTIAK